jgi:hypothetical protein
MNKRKLAFITGWTLILMAFIAIISLGYVFLQFNPTEKLTSLSDLILSRIGLYKSMLMGLSIIVLLDLIVSYTLYKYFENENKKISLIAGISRITYTLIFGLAIYYLFVNLNEVSNQVIHENFQSFQSIWSAGLVIFGLHLCLIGYLMKFHKRIPKILWLMTLIAGASYMVVHSLMLSEINLTLVSTLEMILAFPMAFGELGLAVWLIVKGGKLNSEVPKIFPRKKSKRHENSKLIQNKV